MVNNCVLGTIFQHSLANMIFLDNNCIWPDSDLNLCLSVLWMDYSKYEWSLGSCILEGPHFQLFSPEAILFGIKMAKKNNFSKSSPDKYQGCADDMNHCWFHRIPKRLVLVDITNKLHSLNWFMICRLFWAQELGLFLGSPD